LPDRVVEAFTGVDPVEVEEVVGEDAGREGEECVDTERGDEGGEVFVTAGAAPVLSCRLRRCLESSFSACIAESCKAKRKTSPYVFITKVKGGWGALQGAKERGFVKQIKF
jgi:hypothetical protein